MIGSRIILHTKGDIMKPIYLIDGARTAFGTFGGSLKSNRRMTWVLLQQGKP